MQPLCVHAIQNTWATIVAQSQQQAMEYQCGVKWIMNWYDVA